MKRLYAAILVTTCMATALLTSYAINQLETTRATHTTAPVENIYLAHCDDSGHYQLVATDNERTATAEQALGFWPIPAYYYRQLSVSLGSVTCIPGPMDK